MLGDEATAKDFMKSAFGEPLPMAKQPLRCTFIIGGGKLVRSRYDASLGKWMTSALRELGFEEDKSAAVGDAGVWKIQHDLGQNLIYLHVFPRIASATAAGDKTEGASGAGGTDGGAGAGESLFDSESLDIRALLCELSVLQKMVQSRVASYAQKKRLLTHVLDTIVQLDEMDTLLASRKPLTGFQQQLYEVADRDLLAAKVEWLKGELKTMVAEGKLTAAETEGVLAEMDGRIKALQAEMAKEREKGALAAEKKVAQLTQQLEALQEKRGAVAKGPGTKPFAHPVRMIEEIVKIRRQMDPLLALEKAGRMLTLEETKKLGLLDDLKEKMQQFLGAARGFWETDEEFSKRLTVAAAAVPGPRRR
jgi:polyhydroxyalkanoate synthesis regulator phasin